MPTCLFTNEELPADTRVEHTIPRSMGGRVRSREVTSNAFNNRCSQVIDTWMHEPYASIFNHISRLMAREHRQAPLHVEIPGENGRLIMIDGELTLRGLRIDARDANGRPTAVASEDIEAVRRFAEDQDWDINALDLEHVSVSRQVIAYASRLVLSPDVEIAVLKTCLATWDVVLQEDPDRFTRHPSVAPVLELIRRVVMEDGPAPEELFTQHVNGIAYHLLDHIRRLRRQLGEPTPFEHILVASGNAATGTLDLAMVVADTDPYGFRLPWGGPDTGTLVLANGVLRETGVDGPHRAAAPFSLGARTQYCSFPSGVSTQDEFEPIAAEIAGHRHTAYRRGVDLVERTAPDYVRDGIHTGSRFVAGGLVAEGVRERLHRLFWDRVGEDVETRRTLDQAIDERLAALSVRVAAEAIAQDDVDAEHVTWDDWLALNTQVLDAVADSLGPPGVALTQEMDLAVEPAGGRDIGDPGGRRRR